MVRFGPAGNSKSFYDEGLKHTYQAPKWLKERGLNAFEYSFGRGVNMSDETAKIIGREMKEHDIELSVHAPYYINLANEDDKKAQNSFNYIIRSLEKLKLMGGLRCVMHSGALLGAERKEALNRVYKRMDELLNILHKKDLDSVILCPETMGKYSQIGTVEEICALCSLHPMLIPCIDFGHINSYMQGKLKTKDDYKRIIDIVFDVLKEEKAKYIHIHFSKIKYGPAGEIHHFNFSDPESDEYGPAFEPLAEVLREYKMSPVIICESTDNMAEDAMTMKYIYEKLF
ncbi:MAG: TIM barrel protein [Clostridiales bacterium]|nr:TIM barrel protein [Clostridiales bacterium]